jgi:hypothetical protein
VVVRDTAGHYRQHHFELEPDGRLRIWQEWLTRGELLFDGTFMPPDRIHPDRADRPGAGLELRRRARQAVAGAQPPASRSAAKKSPTPRSPAGCR